MNPRAANLLLGEIRKITDKPVKFVVYNHNHHDHISGGEVFKDQGATIIAHKNVLEVPGLNTWPIRSQIECVIKSTFKNDG